MGKIAASACSNNPSPGICTSLGTCPSLGIWHLCLVSGSVMTCNDGIYATHHRLNSLGLLSADADQG